MANKITEDEAIELAIREAEAMYESRRLERDTKNGYQRMNGAASSDQEALSRDNGTTEPAPRCRFCGTLSTDDKMLRDFGIGICFPCKLAHREDYRCISKSRAVKDYLLSDHELDQLRYAIVVNPNKIGWKDMKLYLVSQVKQEAMRKWGSMNGIEDERKRREEAKTAQRENKAKRKQRSLVEPLEEPNQGTSLIEKEIKKQRMAAVLTSAGKPSPVKVQTTKKVPLPDVFKKRHVHSFGPELPGATSGEFVKTCSGCGVQVVSEVL